MQIERGGGAVPESLRAVGVPVYSHSEVLIGSSIMLALFLVVLIALIAAARARPGRSAVSACGNRWWGRATESTGDQADACSQER